MATATKKRPAPSKRVEISAAQTAETVAKVSAFKPADIRTRLQTLADEARSRLTDLTAEIGDALSMRDDIDTAIAAKKATLASLTGMEEEALRIDDLRARREQAEDDFEAYTEELRQRRQREEAEFNYQLARKRGEEADRYADTLRQRNRADDERRAKIEAELAARLGEIKEQEAEAQGLRDQVAKFPEVLKAEVAKAEAILRGSLNREFEHARALAAAETKAKEQLATLATDALKAENAGLKQAIDRLNAQLIDANAAVQNIAAQAVNASAGREALTAVSNMAAQSAPAAGKTGR